MQPRNDLAVKLMQKLAEIGLNGIPWYFCGQTYCVGVCVSSPSEAL